MFSCVTIPHNDETVDDYICGSTNLNDSLYVFASTVVLICAIVSVACLTLLSSRFDATRESCAASCIKVNTDRVLTYLTFANRQEFSCPNLSRITVFSNKFKRIMRLFIQLTIVMLVVLTPIYIVKHSDGVYTTHTDTYVWFWTLAYTHGVVPASLFMAAWIIMITVCFYHMILVPSIDANPTTAISPSNASIVSDERKDATDISSIKNASMILSLTANLIITIVVNALYIYSTQQPLPEYIHFGVQFGLAIFRLVYAYCVFPLLTRPIIDPIANISFRLRLLTVNNLIIPCFATAFTSPACFQVSSQHFTAVILFFFFLIDCCCNYF